jgi:transcriptional regulator with PAS, ATPase and Fis domain
MSDTPRREKLPLKDRLEALCVEMIDRGILFTEAVEQFEKCFVTEVLARSDHNVLQAAGKLGIHRNTLAKRLARYRLRRP